MRTQRISIRDGQFCVGVTSRIRTFCVGDATGPAPKKIRGRSGKGLTHLLASAKGFARAQDTFASELRAQIGEFFPPGAKGCDGMRQGCVRTCAFRTQTRFCAGDASIEDSTEEEEGTDSFQKKLLPRCAETFLQDFRVPNSFNGKKLYPYFHKTFKMR